MLFRSTIKISCSMSYMSFQLFSLPLFLLQLLGFRTKMHVIHKYAKILNVSVILPARLFLNDFSSDEFHVPHSSILECESMIVIHANQSLPCFVFYTTHNAYYCAYNSVLKYKPF